MIINEFISTILQFAAAAATAAAAAVKAATGLQLQQQYPFESIQIVKQSLCTKFGDNKSIISQIIQFIIYTSLISEKSAAAAAAVL